MKKLIITAAAILFATSAFATDLVKKKAPVPPVKIEEAQTTTLAISGGFVGNSDGKTYRFDIEHYIYGSVNGGVFVAGQIGRDEKDGISNNADASIGLNAPLTGSVAVKGSVGLGKQWVPGEEFSYYIARLGVDARLSDRWTWNVASYEYRNSINNDYNFYERHTVGTGLTYKINHNNALFGKVYHNFNTGVGTDDNGVLVGYAFTF